ncbi:hypothetical protein [Helicobacter kayseriensis]|uniref:hypothetical protein n=1 Tax=Helicobacter kayseriensis TaxID=2905877 RepID=UPI001E4E347F|nr:hypothetical protein [Helicobacter kayseriensis]MCE3046723.1 hypothetical protein [Helicobacter kayseriensis]MCE3047975.1 hypothetical protein [Helicobacter kayseriensis]
MQRSGTFKIFIKLLAFGCFVVYIALTNIYAILPPLLGLLFLAFCFYLKRGEYAQFLLVLLCLFWIEFEKNLGFSGLFFYFLLSYLLFYLPMLHFFSHVIWIKIFCVFMIYLGFGILYFLFLSSEAIDWKELLGLLSGYILIEGLLVWLYELKD